ncbi:MAG: 50S rRNA methyltransferase [Bacteroides sp. SM1_62]|jgi:23S rRNA (pseudouridine1915-N3)-methyltransferase|nr:MAG: 50S rRNA methyltransferase [Bacteroides sp. SM23_62]KPL25083.1 MAG: 50S rRNA methyltransferase [Bacteroides sp. SM1_62]
MKIQLLFTGKTRFPFIREGIEEYRRRLVHYTDFQIRDLPDLRNSGSWPEKKVKGEEGKNILKAIDPRDYVVLLDERGKHMDSLAFAGLLEKLQYGSFRTLLFVIGGPYGFAGEIHQRADLELSLSKMTFSHQLARLIFLEQLYRAYTIIRGEPYHHG